MALQAFAIGALKTALKSAAKKVATETAIEVAAGNTAKAALATSLEKVGTKAMTDAQAIVLNRLKSAPSKTLFEFASNELGLPIKEVKKIVNTFNQTAKMKEMSLGQNFKELARTKLKKELGTKETDRIKDIVRKANEFNKKVKKRKIESEPMDYNKTVQALLINIQSEFESKINGLQHAKNKHKVTEHFDLDIMKYFDANKNYDVNNVYSLEQVETLLSMDLERYSADDDVILIDEGKWNVYSKSAIIDYINNVKEDVKLSLR